MMSHFIGPLREVFSVGIGKVFAKHPCNTRLQVWLVGQCKVCGFCYCAIVITLVHYFSESDEDRENDEARTFTLQQWKVNDICVEDFVVSKSKRRCTVRSLN